jgi:hypothetical protein
VRPALVRVRVPGVVVPVVVIVPGALARVGGLGQGARFLSVAAEATVS